MSRLLIIDDDPAIRDIANRILGRAGHDLETVASAEEGLARCDKTRFDLVVTDLTLPGMSGASFAQIVRQRFPWMRILVFSGLLSTPETAIPLDLVPDTPHLHLLAKPFRPRELLAAVTALLQHEPEK
ncbi:MAG: response regulator [Magnetococcales bacterium]|nr:response regulator [Magnetococcales bacterium]